MSNPNQATIRPGATGDVVRRLQRGLDRANPGEVLVVDGRFGPKTEMLLKQFQASHGLAADGVAGPLTWHALPNGGPMPTLGEGSNGPIVTALQQLLTEAAFVEGASPGPATASTDRGPKQQSRPSRASNACRRMAWLVKRPGTSDSMRAPPPVTRSRKRLAWPSRPSDQ
jgi:peptidoglycan hydrolase-like protein with peptidoglycan-binding domain